MKPRRSCVMAWTAFWDNLSAMVSLPEGHAFLLSAKRRTPDEEDGQEEQCSGSAGQHG
jgi:hypothetical protein